MTRTDCSVTERSGPGCPHDHRHSKGEPGAERRNKISEGEEDSGSVTDCDMPGTIWGVCILSTLKVPTAFKYCLLINRKQKKRKTGRITNGAVSPVQTK